MKGKDRDLVMVRHFFRNVATMQIATQFNGHERVPTAPKHMSLNNAEARNKALAERQSPYRWYKYDDHPNNDHIGPVPLKQDDLGFYGTNVGLIVRVVGEDRVPVAIVGQFPAGKENEAVLDMMHEQMWRYDYAIMRWNGTAWVNGIAVVDYIGVQIVS